MDLESPAAFDHARHSYELGLATPGLHIGAFFSGPHQGPLVGLVDSTSPKLIVVPLTTPILERGVGEVGRVVIPLDIWRRLAPSNFADISRRSFSSLMPVQG